jgi:hypothetical protein
LEVDELLVCHPRLNRVTQLVCFFRSDLQARVRSDELYELLQKIGLD